MKRNTVSGIGRHGDGHVVEVVAASPSSWPFVANPAGTTRSSRSCGRFDSDDDS
ncbi:hypothetical protein [Candidatus Poriferisodalis sp.]|uniref:hypothetical protein n=1 Tax=Candidatus Poriferisodalis sp. TaxID=3101277 RepID=UPI003B01FE32